MLPQDRIVWREVTRNSHVGSLDDIPVVCVRRPQKHRRDGTKYDWGIEVLNCPFTWSQCFNQHDPRDLDSTKMAAVAKVCFAIDTLYEMLHAKPKARARRSSVA